MVMIQNEDDAEDTVVPRLISAGADLGRVHFLTGISACDRSGIRPFTLEDVWAIETLVATLTRPRLVTIDPVGSYCGRADSHKDAEVRGLLMPLAELARRREISIIGNAHFNKGNGRAIDRGMGSVAWVAAARAAWGLVKDPENPVNRLFLPIKCNLAKDTSGLSFQIIDGDGAPAWHGAKRRRPGRWTTSSAQANNKRSPNTNAAVEWLKSFLADGDAAQKAVQDAANAKGYDYRILRTAKEVLGVRPYKLGFGKDAVWYWALSTKNELTPHESKDAEF